LSKIEEEISMTKTIESNLKKQPQPLKIPRAPVNVFESKTPMTPKVLLNDNSLQRFQMEDPYPSNFINLKGDLLTTPKFNIKPFTVGSVPEKKSAPQSPNPI
jgi:hypothetical protein